MAHSRGFDLTQFADEAWAQGRVAARVLGRQAWKAGKAVRRDPVPATMAVIGLACLLSLLTASPRRR
jgi:hypothetical protein